MGPTDALVAVPVRVVPVHVISTTERTSMVTQVDKKVQTYSQPPASMSENMEARLAYAGSKLQASGECDCSLTFQY